MAQSILEGRPGRRWLFGAKRRLPGQGRVRIFPNSGLRKLARAMRRGMVPDERQVVIDIAMAKTASEVLRALKPRRSAGDFDTRGTDVPCQDFAR